MVEVDVYEAVVQHTMMQMLHLDQITIKAEVTIHLELNLKDYGFHIKFSVFEVKNSEKDLDNYCIYIYFKLLIQ